MAATEKWAAQATFARLRERGIPAAEIKTPNLLALIPTALRRLAQKRGDYFQEETNVSLAAGIGDLAALEAAGYLPETIDAGQIFHANSNYPLQPVADEAQLRFPWPKMFIYYCFSGNQIKTLNIDSSLTSLTGSLRVTAVKIPAIGDLESQIQPEFLDEMEILSLPQK